MILFPSNLVAQSFKVNLSPKHEQKLSAVKSGHQRMMRYYKFYKKDSAKHFKAWGKAAKRYQDSLFRTQLGTEKLKAELAKRGISADWQWQYAQQVQEQFGKWKQVMKNPNATAIEKQQAKKELRKLTKSGLNKQIAATPLASLKPNQMGEATRLELNRWWAITKDTTSSDSVRKMAGEKVKTIALSHAMGDPKFQGLYQYYKQYGQSPDWQKLSAQVPGMDTLKVFMGSPSDKVLASAEKAAEAGLKNSTAVKGFYKQTKEVEKWRKQFNALGNRDSLMKSGKAMAIDHFANQKEALQSAQNKATGLLGKYREYFNSGDSTVGIKRSSLKGKAWRERIVLGGNFNVVSTSPFSVDISPLAGYRFNTKFYVGVGINYRCTFSDSLRYKYYVSPSNTSIRLFANYDLIKNFFAYVEVEQAGVKSKLKEGTGNQWMVNYFVGLGKKLLVHPKFYVTFTALYNFNGQNQNSSYASRFQLRVGFQTSDLAFRRKKVYYQP